MLILPFEVGALRFEHVLPGTDEHQAAVRYWRSLSDTALFKNRKTPERSEWCPPTEGKITIVFQVLLRKRIWGTWAFYAVRGDGGEPMRFTACVAPMLPCIIEDPPLMAPVRDLIHWFLENEMVTTEGGRLQLAKVDVPGEADSADPIDQHKWNHPRSRLAREERISYGLRRKQSDRGRSRE